MLNKTNFFDTRHYFVTTEDERLLYVYNTNMIMTEKFAFYNTKYKSGDVIKDVIILDKPINASLIRKFENYITIGTNYNKNCKAYEKSHKYNHIIYNKKVSKDYKLLEIKAENMILDYGIKYYVVDLLVI